MKNPITGTAGMKAELTDNKISSGDIQPTPLSISGSESRKGFCNKLHQIVTTSKRGANALPAFVSGGGKQIKIICKKQI